MDDINDEKDEITEEDEDIDYSIEPPRVEVEDYFEKLLRIQEEQLLRLNRNIELTNAILGEISVTLASERE